ncbi:MAG: ureidoacrylate peracid hydrolase [Chloroflexi bacterium]|jgi:ureidoacrylate peracid hydrolase|nr:MAG: ureidoacrylate peracid hydrolase [Chloroflexota bacterium]
MLTTLEEKVDPRHAALLVIDMQNDFCHEEGGRAKRGHDIKQVQEILPQLNRLIGEARGAGMPVFFIRGVHSEWTDSEVRRERHQNKYPAARSNCYEGSWGAELYGVTPEPGDQMITKNRYSAFINTNLDLILRAQGIKSIITTGTSTDACVESTARDGFMMDYYIVFVDDCCGAATQEAHEGSLRAIRSHFGVVVRSEDVINALPREKVLTGMEAAAVLDTK